MLELLASAERHPPTPTVERKSAFAPSSEAESSPLAGGELSGDSEERGRSRSRGRAPGSKAAGAGLACPGLGGGDGSATSASRRRSSHSHSSPLTEGTPGSSSTGQTPALPPPTTTTDDDFFPGRKSREVKSLNPEASWKVITGVIEPDLMDTLIRSYLSTTHLLWPFLHVPSFLADYANPKRWGEPGFARFIVAVCTLSSRRLSPLSLSRL